ncbi:MAG: hydrolase 1, exosortase A system-associated [Novosphingobium sp.]|nr:hydrolase 1, exosortase A system-associated [Novosphingobium sp.]
MSRRHVTFDCEGARLVGSIDEGAAATGLLLVSGGNEVRSGAWNGQAQFAAQIAAEGFPVFRFDRRGTGDSEGANGEFQSSAPDINAAYETFRVYCPHIERIVGFGNCDAASALMLAEGAGLDVLVLSNPWTFEDTDEPPPPEAVRAHYRQRLADGAAIKRLLTGKVSLRKLLGSLFGAMRPATPPSTLAQDMASAIAGFSGPILFPIAERDRTGQAFLSAWPKDDPRIRVCGDATHSYVESHSRDWLAKQVLEVLRG